MRAVVRQASLNHYPITKLQELREIATQSVGITSAPESRRQEIWDLLARWEMLALQLKATDEKIEALVMDYAPARALINIPELSWVGAATILSELGALEDYEHHRQILKLAGMNLVGSDSGGFKGRRRQSKRGRPLLRRQLFLLATRWCKKKGLFRGQYEAMLARNGGCKIKAIAALARKLTPLILEIAKTEQPFDRKRWMRERRLRRARRTELYPALPRSQRDRPSRAWEGML